MIILGSIFVLVSLLIAGFGVASIFIFKNLYMRIVASTIIDTVATLLFLIGLIFLLFEGSFVFRILLLMVFILMTSPISTHVNIRSAYLAKLSIRHDQERKR